MILSAISKLVNADIFDGVRTYIAEDLDAPNWRGDVFVFFLRVGLVTAVALSLLLSATYLGVVRIVVEPAVESYFHIAAGIIVVNRV